MNNRLEIAHREAAVFGGKPQVVRYYNDDNSLSIDVLSCEDTPTVGVTSWGSVGMSEFDTGLATGDRDLRVEIVGACSSAVPQFGNVIASCAFNVASGFQISPGAVHPGVVEAYLPGLTMKHALFIPLLLLWGQPMDNLEGPTSIVTWLQIVPISDEEYKFAINSGSDSLESRFQAADIDVFDLERPSLTF
jgi:antitoxin YqcF